MEWLKLNEEGEIEFVSEEIKLVPEVQALLALKYNKGAGDVDGRKRYRAKEELKYLYLNYSAKSPYRDYTDLERLGEAKKVCSFPADWKESDEFKALLPKYLKAAPSKIERLLGTAESVLDKLEVYFKGIDFTQKDKNGALVYEPKEVMESLNKLPKLASTLQELTQQVKIGVIGVPKSKGDHEIGWMAMNDNTSKKKVVEQEIED